MRASSCADETPSLDQVIERAIHSGGAGTSAALSHLLDAHSTLALEVARTPAAQALRDLCRSVVERRHTPDSLLHDTAWWAAETARLSGSTPCSAVPSAPAAPDRNGRAMPHTAGPTPWAMEAADVLRTAQHLVKATHACTSTAEAEAAAAAAAAASAAGEGCDSFSARQRSTSAAAPPMEKSETNVLLLLDDVGGAQEANWESLDFTSGDGGELQGGAELRHRPMGREEEALAVLDAWVLAEPINDGDAGESAAACLDSVEYLLQHRPEMIVRHEELATLQHRVAECAWRSPTQRWTATAFTFFHALPSRSQLVFVHDVLSALHSVSSAVPHSGGDNTRRLQFLQSLLLELPEQWLPLLDSEVTELLVRVVAEAAIPFSAALDAIDPEAAWLGRWCTRPSCALSIAVLVSQHAEVIAALRSSLSTSSHTLSLLLYLLPYMFAQPHATPSATAGQGSVQDSAALPSETPQSAFLFTEALRRLSCPEAVAATLPDGVYELGTRALGGCVAHLTPALKHLSFTTLMDGLLGDGRRSLPRSEERALAFLLSLLTEVLCCPDTQCQPLWDLSWCTADMWGSVDTALRLRVESAVGTAAAVEAAEAPSSSPSSSLLAAAQECWCRLLSCHPHKLPGSLQALVEAIAAADAPPSGSGLFTWHTLAAVSSTVAGWRCLQPHLWLLPAESPRSVQHYSALLSCILASGEASALVDAAVPTPGPATASRPPSSAGRAAASGPAPLRGFTPASVALLLRWCTDAAARRGLEKALAESSRHFLSQLQRCEGTVAPPAAHSWLLSLPVESYPQSGMADISYGEDTRRWSRNTRSLACYQSLSLLIACAALPEEVAERGGGGPDHAGAAAVETLWQQLCALWIGRDEGSDDEAAAVANHPPFDEESLLTLLSALAVCVLTNPAAEYAMWFSPDAVLRRLQQLRAFCVARRGVDVVYFVVRYLTSGKGRKRLPAILLDGCGAELTVDTTIDVSDFAQGEDLPAGVVAAAVEETAVLELLAAAFPHTAAPVAAGEMQDARGCRADSQAEGAASSPSGLPSLRWSAPLRRFARLLLSHCEALRTTPLALQQQLASRPAAEWDAFADHHERALAVAQALESDYADAATVLRRGSVDPVYLASLCVSNWLWLPSTHLTSPRRKLCWAALQYVAANGVEAWDRYVARSLAQHVDRLQRDVAAFSSAAVAFPCARALPLPSPLFVLLLVKPFSLAQS